jgi:hypothetical protein
MIVVAAGTEADRETSDCLWWGQGNEDELLISGEILSGDGTSICKSSYTNTECTILLAILKTFNLLPSHTINLNPKTFCFKFMEHFRVAAAYGR